MALLYLEILEGSFFVCLFPFNATPRLHPVASCCISWPLMVVLDKRERGRGERREDTPPTLLFHVCCGVFGEEERVQYIMGIGIASRPRLAGIGKGGMDGLSWLILESHARLVFISFLISTGSAL